MKLSQSQRAQFIGAIVVAVIIGWQLGVHAEQNRMISRFGLPKDTITGTGAIIIDPEKEADMSIVWSVWRELLRSYIEPSDMNPTTMIRGAAQGLTEAVGDPYTTFLPPQEAKEFHQSLDGRLEGIGAELREEGDYIAIVHPIKGSPAERIGLRKDDIITEVNGADIAGWSIDKVVSNIRGPGGTQVTLKIYRKGEPKPLTVTITRETIRIPSVEGRIVKTATGSIGVIALAQFGEDTVQEVKQAIADVRKEDIKGMIIDLRGNGGGYLESAISIASMFQKEGTVVTVDKRGQKPDVRSVSGQPTEPTIPLVVLINEGSASASEILAGSLQDHKRAIVVGMTSFGKGTVQEVHDLADGSVLKVTVARWITPGGKNLAKEGVHPDIVRDITPADLEAKKDPQLDAAYAAVFHHIWRDGIVQK